MKVDFMRKMDYWIGNPLCFSLSCLHILGRVFPRKKKEPKKVLFLELSEMGSTVLAYAAMSKTKELWPSSELYFMIFKQNQESVKLLEIIPEKNLILIDNSSLFRFKITVFKALIRMKKEKPGDTSWMDENMKWYLKRSREARYLALAGDHAESSIEILYETQMALPRTNRFHYVARSKRLVTCSYYGMLREASMGLPSSQTLQPLRAELCQQF